MELICLPAARKYEERKKSRCSFPPKRNEMMTRIPYCGLIFFHCASASIFSLSSVFLFIKTLHSFFLINTRAYLTATLSVSLLHPVSYAGNKCYATGTFKQTTCKYCSECEIFWESRSNKTSQRILCWCTTPRVCFIEKRIIYHERRKALGSPPSLCLSLTFTFLLLKCRVADV